MKFWSYMLYGIVEAAAVYMIVYIPCEDSLFENGYTVSFWSGGHMVFEACILMSNLTLIRSMNNFTAITEVWTVLSISTFYIFLYLENLIPGFPQLYGIWTEFVTLPIHWLSLFLVCATFYLAEIGYKSFDREIMKIFKREDKKQN